jgi:hypothetical protein
LAAAEVSRDAFHLLVDAAGPHILS